MILVSLNFKPLVLFFQSCAIPLFELLVREKSDTKESKGIYLISQNKDNPEMYEIVCNTNSEREAWIREIRAASEKCPPEDEIQPQESDEEERRQMMERSNKIREIIGTSLWFIQQNGYVITICSSKIHDGIDLLYNFTWCIYIQNSKICYKVIPNKMDSIHYNTNPVFNFIK